MATKKGFPEVFYVVLGSPSTRDTFADGAAYESLEEVEDDVTRVGEYKRVRVGHIIKDEPRFEED